jgi:hemerythrin superfamily protein
MKTVSYVDLFSNLFVMSKSSYTELQKQEIQHLSERIKEIHEPRLSHIEPITNDMVHLVHYDDELKSIYNKKTVIVASLKELFIKETHTEAQNRERMAQIQEYEKYIAKRLYEEDLKKQKRPSRCSKSLTSMCVVS